MFVTLHFLDTRDGKTPMLEEAHGTLIERNEKDVTILIDGEEYGYEKANGVWWEMNGEACATITYRELDSWELEL